VAIVKIIRPTVSTEFVSAFWIVIDVATRHQQSLAPRFVPSHVKTAMARDEVAWFAARWNGRWWIIGDRVANPGAKPDPLYPCSGCATMRPHGHLQERAHGLAGTHMHGSERFVCQSCGRSVGAWDKHAHLFPFVLDYADRVVSSGKTRVASHQEPTDASG